jgi:hypothetical protein
MGLKEVVWLKRLLSELLFYLEKKNKEIKNRKGEKKALWIDASAIKPT